MHQLKDRTDFCVYEHVCPDGMKYVGMTCQKPQERWGRDGKQYRSQPVYQSILKYGWDNIEHNILASGLSLQEAQKMERTLIAQNKENGLSLNVDKGGDVQVVYHIDGQQLTSEDVAAMSTLDNLTSHDITTRLTRGWDLDRALSQKKIAKNTLYEYRGKMYTTAELAKLSPLKEMTASALDTRLNHYGWDVERAMTQPFGTKLQPHGLGDRIYEYQGKMYNSYELCQISSVPGITISDISTRINHHGWSVERAITQPKKSHNTLYEYNGGMYTTTELLQFAADDKIANHDITDRLKNGWTVWEAVNIPKGTNRKRFYKTQK